MNFKRGAALGRLSAPMNAPVKLADLTDALEMPSEEWAAWLDRETGQVVVVECSAIDAVEDAEGDEPLTGLADWQQEQVAAARAINAGGPRYLALPDKFDFHEYREMERFIETVADADAAEQLWRAIKGQGAFRRFKDTAARLGRLDAWFAYRDEAMKRFVLAWAEVNAVAVDESPRRPQASEG